MINEITVYIKVGNDFYKTFGIDDSDVSDVINNNMCHLCCFEKPEKCPKDIDSGELYCGHGHFHFYKKTDEIALIDFKNVISTTPTQFQTKKPKHFAYNTVVDGKIYTRLLCNLNSIIATDSERNKRDFINVAEYDKISECKDCNCIMQSYPQIHEFLRMGVNFVVTLHDKQVYSVLYKIITRVYEKLYYNRQGAAEFIRDYKDGGEFKIYVTEKMLYVGDEQFNSAGIPIDKFIRCETKVDEHLATFIKQLQNTGKTFKIPEWCHVNAFVYFTNGGFGSILRVSEKEQSVVIKCISMFVDNNNKEYIEKISNLKPAIFRRWNDEEINSLIPFAVCRRGTKETSTVIHTSEGVSGALHVIGGHDCGFFSYEQFMKKYCLPNGLECGMYEIGNYDFNDTEESQS